MKKALIVYGGWEGHEPAEIASFFRDMLVQEQFQVEVSDNLDSLLNMGKASEGCAI